MKEIFTIDEETKNEVKILSSINNEHIVKYYNSFEDDDKYYINMELCDI